MSAGAQPSAAGVRQPYDDIAGDVRSWIEEWLGAPVIRAATQAGGMSPGCAARLRTANGRSAFVKAVSSETNLRTPELFRHEIAVLSRLDSVPYRPDVLATYDDGTWVALLLEDIDGRHPDLNDPTQSAAVWSMVETQSRELTPPPGGLDIDTLSTSVERSANAWIEMAADPYAFLPAWAASRAEVLSERVATLADRLLQE